MLLHICISFLVLCLTVGGQSLVVDTPIGVTHCSTTLLTWSGGVPPYTVYLSPPLSTSISRGFPQTSNTTIIWGADFLPGEGDQFIVHVNDSANAFATSGVFTIAPCILSTASRSTVLVTGAPSTFIYGTQTSITTIFAQETSAALTGVKSGPSSGVIIGGVIGGVLLLTIVIGSTLWYQRRKRNRRPIIGDGVVHGFEVRNTSVVPGRSKNDTLRRASDASVRALFSSSPPQQHSSALMFSRSPPLDSLVLGPGHLSSSDPPRTIETHSPPVYLPAPQSHGPFPIPLSPRPPTYVTTDMTHPQSNLPEFAPWLAQDVAERNLTDGDVEAIARRLMEMQRDQRS